MSIGGLTGPVTQLSESGLSGSGSSTGQFLCVVVDNNDPKKSGGCKLRPLDIDKKSIPDDKLNWGYPVRPDDPSLSGVSGVATQFLPGSIVWASYAAGQLVIHGSHAAQSNQKKERPQEKGGQDLNKPTSGDGEIGGDRRLQKPFYGSKSGGQINGSTEETPEFDDKGPTEHAVLESPNSYGDPTAKNSWNTNNWSLGTFKFQGQKSATSFIKGLNPQNISGAIPSALDMVMNLKKVKGNMNPRMPASVGPQELMQALTFIQKIFDPKKQDKEHNTRIQMAEDFINNPTEEEQSTSSNSGSTEEVGTVITIVDGGELV